MQEKSAAVAAPDKAKPAGITIDTLVDGAQKACSNAEALFSEAQLLSKHGAHARALSLHQISLEECSKVELLGAWSMSLLRGTDLDPRQITKAFGSHAAKNKLNAYMLEPSEEEIAARDKGDWQAALEAFEKTQTGFHKFSNSNKNASLYVDWTGAAFVAPVDVISAKLTTEIAGLNARFLDHARLQMRMFARLQSSGDLLKPLLTELMGKLEKLGGEKTEDRIAGADVAMSEFLEAAIATSNRE